MGCLDHAAILNMVCLYYYEYTIVGVLGVLARLVGVMYFNTILSPSNNNIIYRDGIHAFKRTLKESIFMSINIS